MKTTREAAREASHKNLVELLTVLLEKNYDAEKGYKKAIEHTKNADLKHFLRNQAAQRNHFATELDKQIHMLNEHPKSNSNGSALGTLHRLWIDVKSSWAKKDDEAILEECIRGEKASLKEYEERISKNILSPKIKIMLENQRDKIRETISEIKKLEDL
ncbi:PA2169 family four-helix-bundle protein [Gramella jeungdoensis]|uniref:PA2169 family four-helix-bundle protein n=1 Tax=Gramella jeungdoensis TaxID=708091 RepID=A0ABT0Z3Z1_9FLAO|nr:PA2169 family four-helix-bundle protein [Gramella jeungdoensis]MCM8570133.1 PA2169 family four-helix-bundle protein [Gramella jeungdoensis]